MLHLSEKRYKTFFSPAKVNLFFKILFKRKDGYHEIASLYQAINLGDRLHLKLSDKDSFRSSGFDLPFDKSNLICKALQVFREEKKGSFGVDLFLEKRIPMQAGLGGGSSNAATMLWALNELLDRPFSFEQLLLMGQKLGSDINFFFSSGTSFCTGRGELFENIPSHKLHLFLVKPSFGMSTEKVYKKVDFFLKTRHTKEVEEALLSYHSKQYEFFNDLESFAFELEPKLLEVKNELLRYGFKRVIMTGSGSSFFCWGDFVNPKIKDFEIFKIETIQRNPQNWYPLR